jgi:hypothetical protein
LPLSTDEDLRSILRKIITRKMTLLARRGVLIEEHGKTYMAGGDAGSNEATTLRLLQAAAFNYRIALRPHAGHKVRTMQNAMPRDVAIEQRLCASS